MNITKNPQIKNKSVLNTNPTSAEIVVSAIPAILMFNKNNKLKYTDIGGTFGFMGYYPKTDFVPQMSLSFYYKGIKLSQSDNLQFRLTTNYNYAINPGFGFNGILNYRFKQFKNL